MTENLQADCVQSRQAGFIQCFLKATPHKACTSDTLADCVQNRRADFVQCFLHYTLFEVLWQVQKLRVKPSGVLYAMFPLDMRNCAAISL